MGCLYCGKEIGPFRQIRDSEFCSDVHRRKHRDCLGRALDQLGTPDPPPAGIAAFRIQFPIHEGRNTARPSGCITHPHPTHVSRSWPVSVTPTLGSSFRPAQSAPRAALHALEPEPAHARFGAPPVHIPAFVLTVEADEAEIDATPLLVNPRLCPEWMAAPAPQPAERWISACSGDAVRAGIALRLPEIASIPAREGFVAKADSLAILPRAEAVERQIRLATIDRPAAHDIPGTLPAFALHTVEENSAQPGSAAQALPLAGPRSGLRPAPVESMPEVPALAPAALPASPAASLPSIAALTAQVLPQASAVAGLPAVPAESRPAFARALPEPLANQPELRLPDLRRVRPADDASEFLTVPAAAAGPAPVESLPAAATFVALPVAASPAAVAPQFRRRAAAHFAVLSAADHAPNAAVPPEAAPRRFVPNPVSRISAQPAGRQPERPVPAIPQPGAYHLEYFCQRMPNTPVKRIEPMASKPGLILQPFAMRPAVLPVEELLREKPSRVVLPFEEIFAKQPAPGAKNARININTAGKIAAAVMVGIALWAGSRVANLSRHTEQFKAEVAASERTVAVAESRGPDPTQRNFGSGPVGRVRRAIANRAATEITDTFRGGMAAWGAQGQSWAPGWKHNAKGYVSTGEMALFQPSLHYTDYRMEFYGQIEDKSIGWVVRAQDKKNYYAMKFTVIEPGLRPIIAVVHYAVVNGKPGHKIETPLSVMVHNHRPLHVAVDVRGNRFTASVDGERIESWTDDTLAQGGVGFFSDAGERARLYWMKLSRNQDWLGRFCAYLSGDAKSRQQNAELWAPWNSDEPSAPRLPAAPVLALAAVRPWRIGKNARSEEWNS